MNKGSRIVFLCFFLLLPMIFSSCAKTVLPGAEPLQTPSTPPVAKANPLDEARNAFTNGNYALAETISLRLTENKSLSAADSAEAGRILAAAALRNNHPSVALTGLEHWRNAASGADTGKEWQDAWCRALRNLSSHDARTRANALYQDSSRSLVVRCVAGTYMAVRQWGDGEMGQSAAALENIYASTSSNQEKAAVERRLAFELSKADAKTSALAHSSVTEENREKFPYNVILIDHLRRQSQRADTRENAEAELAYLKSRTQLADPSLFNAPPKETEIHIAPAAASGLPIQPGQAQIVALALPLSGQYSTVSSKIVAGAEAAREDLAASGSPISLVVLDTERPDWIASADALPAEAVVIGGPLRRSDYNQAKSSGLTSRRVLMAFLPSLDAGDEGNKAWRFFSSAQDQANALLQFTSRLGISTYGIFYPDDNFGRGMASLFEQRAKESGASSVTSGSYNPDNQTSWTTSAKNFLTSAKGSDSFKAIFLPDSWKNMDVIVPNFFYYDETRQVLMGTSLWEQGLSGSTYVSAQYYGLAVFPGAWNSAKPTSAGQKLQSRLAASGKNGADHWSGLGYDFARLAAQIGIRQGWTPQSVNAALASASLNWSIAPISWNGGQASQRMFLFSPKENGFAPVDEAAFKAAYEAAWSR